MKNLIFIILLALVLAGCPGGTFQIQETPTHQAIAYGAGKAMGLVIMRVIPKADEELQGAFDGLMERNKANLIVPPDEAIAYFSESVLILGRFSKNPYGLVGDLSAILLIFGAQYDPAGNLVGIQPVPKSVIMWFGMGYDSGRAAILQEDLAK